MRRRSGADKDFAIRAHALQTRYHPPLFPGPFVGPVHKDDLFIHFVIIDAVGVQPASKIRWRGQGNNAQLIHFLVEQRIKSNCVNAALRQNLLPSFRGLLYGATVIGGNKKATPFAVQRQVFSASNNLPRSGIHQSDAPALFNAIFGRTCRFARATPGADSEAQTKRGLKRRFPHGGLLPLNLRPKTPAVHIPIFQ